MWGLCPVTLEQGDCLELMKHIPNGSVDMVLCDLPYGTTACKWDAVIPFEPLWEHYKRVVKTNGAIVLFSAQPFTTKLIQSNFRDFKYCWYWLKNQSTGFAYARYQPMRKVEDICVFYRRHGVYNPQGLVAVREQKPKQHNNWRDEHVYKVGTLSKEYTPRFTNWPKNVLQFNTERGLHPTQKPVALLEYLVKTYTNPGDLVLDNCMGSGSTGVACVNTGRRFIGMEKEKEYFETAKQRINDAVFSLPTN